MGAWSIDEKGEFTLNESYKGWLADVKAIGTEAWQEVVDECVAESGSWLSRLDGIIGEEAARKVATLYLSHEDNELSQKARKAGGNAWREAVYSHLVERTEYDYDYLRMNMVERLDHEELDGRAVVDGFIVSALEGSI